MLLTGLPLRSGTRHWHYVCFSRVYLQIGAALAALTQTLRARMLAESRRERRNLQLALASLWTAGALEDVRGRRSLDHGRSGAGGFLRVLVDKTRKRADRSKRADVFCPQLERAH